MYLNSYIYTYHKWTLLLRSYVKELKTIKEPLKNYLTIIGDDNIYLHIAVNHVKFRLDFNS